jgi:nitroreductase
MSDLGSGTTENRSFAELVTHQRACRRFDAGADLPDEDVLTMITHATHAPSAENSQPWEFVVIRSIETRRRFGDIMSEAWAIGGADYVRQAAPPTVYADIEDGIAAGGLLTAPVVVVVCADLDRVAEPWSAASIYPATQNLLLSAAYLGYGSCLTTGLTTIFADQVRDLLSLPSTVVPMAGVYLGRAARRLGLPRRDPAATHMHRETYGNSWT